MSEDKGAQARTRGGFWVHSRIQLQRSGKGYVNKAGTAENSKGYTESSAFSSALKLIILSMCLVMQSNLRHSSRTTENTEL